MKSKFLTVFLVLTVLLMSTTTNTVFADDGSNPPAPDPVPQCTDNCEVLPKTGETPVDGSYTVDAVIPGTDVGTGSAGMTGDLTVGGQTFNDVPAVCGDAQDHISIGVDTPFDICPVTDVNCLNTMRTEHGANALTQDEATFYGKSFDDIFENAVTSGLYTSAIQAFRFITGDLTNPYTFTEGDDLVSTWLGLPKNQADVQSLAWWLKDCSDNVPPPPPPPPENHKKPHPKAGGVDISLSNSPTLNTIGSIQIEKIWGKTKDMPIVEVDVDAESNLINPKGTVGVYGRSSYFCHLNILEGDKSVNDICFSLGSLIIGDMVKINGKNLIVSSKEEIYSNEWLQKVNSSITLTSCARNSWDSKLKEYEKLVVLTLTQ